MVLLYGKRQSNLAGIKRWINNKTKQSHKQKIHAKNSIQTITSREEAEYEQRSKAMLSIIQRPAFYWFIFPFLLCFVFFCPTRDEIPFLFFLHIPSSANISWTLFKSASTRETPARTFMFCFAVQNKYFTYFTHF